MLPAGGRASKVGAVSFVLAVALGGPQNTVGKRFSVFREPKSTDLRCSGTMGGCLGAQDPAQHRRLPDTRPCGSQKSATSARRSRERAAIPCCDPPEPLRNVRAVSMRQENIIQSGGPWPRLIDSALVLGHRAKRGVIRSVAIATMLVIYAAGSIGSIASSALGVAGISSLALTATTTPANAWRRRRHRRRWHNGYYDDDWSRRRRRRRRRRFRIHLHF